MTECNQNEFAFAPHFSRQLSARFSERQLSTEGGALLLRETDRKVVRVGPVAPSRSRTGQSRHDARQRRFSGLTAGVSFGRFLADH